MKRDWRPLCWGRSYYLLACLCLLGPVTVSVSQSRSTPLKLSKGTHWIWPLVAVGLISFANFFIIQCALIYVSVVYPPYGESVVLALPPGAD